MWLNKRSAMLPFLLALVSVMPACFEITRLGGVPTTNSSTFTSNVGPVGSPTVLANGVARQGMAFTYTPDISGIANLTGATFSVTNKPSWATFNTKTGTLTGTAIDGAAANVTITATNGANSKAFGPFDFTPATDPIAVEAWHLKNTGQKAFSQTPAVTGHDLRVEGAILLGYTGKGVRVAVSDDGLEIAHEDLSMNILAGESKNYAANGFAANDPTPKNADSGHGTAVGGLIAAGGWNGKGSRGVAPDASLAGLNFLQNTAVGPYLDQIGGDFDVYNQSWGSGLPPGTGFYVEIDPNPVIREAYLSILASGVTKSRGGHGSLYVRSAGNSYQHTEVGSKTGIYRQLPSGFDELNNHPTTLVVGAMNSFGVRSSYSSTGSNLWVSGMGGQDGFVQPAMISTDMYGCDRGMKETVGATTVNSFESGTGNTDCRYTSIMNGTSSAAPTVAGVVALILQARPGLSWRDVKYILAKTSTQVHLGYQPPANSFNPVGYISEPGWIENAAPEKFHFHNWYGFGRVDAGLAVATAMTYSSKLGPLKDFITPEGDFRYGSGNINLPINNNNVAAPTGVSTINVPESITIEAVQILVNITHSFPGDVGIELISPSGTKSIVIPMNNAFTTANITNAVFLTNAFYGEQGGGNWTIRVLDGNNTNNTAGGTLNNWKINIVGY